MSLLTSVHTDDAPGALGPYSQAIETGDWIFASGQIPHRPPPRERSSREVSASRRTVFCAISRPSLPPPAAVCRRLPRRPCSSPTWPSSPK